MFRLLAGAFAALAMLAAGGAAAGRPLPDGDNFGVLVMAHGGGAAWNGQVEAMLAPLQEDYPLELAFGMADPGSLQTAVSRLEARGVRRIGVVRLFVSGESWQERTEQILGLAPGAAPRPADAQAGHGGHSGHDMSLWRIETVSTFALSAEGLADAPEMGAVLVERAAALSRDAARESVLVLAHGPGDDAENARWLTRIDARADALRTAAPYREVRVETLREDWPDKRAEAETRIRAFVTQAGEDGGRAVVIPYRVAGFGPYARVLDGLDYASDGRGLLPSPQVGQWVRRQAERLRAGDFRRPLPTP